MKNIFKTICLIFLLTNFSVISVTAEEEKKLLSTDWSKRIFWKV